MTARMRRATFLLSVLSLCAFTLPMRAIGQGSVTIPGQYEKLLNNKATLATLGMGDITPLDHLAKSLTAMEAMFGQLFVAIIIAKLVSVWWYVPSTSKT